VTMARSPRQTNNINRIGFGPRMRDQFDENARPVLPLADLDMSAPLPDVAGMRSEVSIRRTLDRDIPSRIYLFGYQIFIPYEVQQMADVRSLGSRVDNAIVDAISQALTQAGIRVTVNFCSEDTDMRIVSAPVNPSEISKQDGPIVANKISRKIRVKKLQVPAK
jgi:hypothetical protein